MPANGVTLGELPLPVLAGVEGICILQPGPGQLTVVVDALPLPLSPVPGLEPEPDPELGLESDPEPAPLLGLEPEPAPEPGEPAAEPGEPDGALVSSHSWQYSVVVVADGLLSGPEPAPAAGGAPEPGAPEPLPESPVGVALLPDEVAGTPLVASHPQGSVTVTVLGVSHMSQ